MILHHLCSVTLSLFEHAHEQLLSLEALINFRPVCLHSLHNSEAPAVTFRHLSTFVNLKGQTY